MNLPKLLTPMKRLNAHFKRFDEVLKNAPYKIVELNHRQEKTQYLHYEPHVTKAITSHFLRIYQFCKDSSLAFKFTYLNDDLKTVSEHQYIEIVFKENDIIESSSLYNVEDMKLLMKSINNMLEIKGKFNSAFVMKFLKDLTVAGDDDIQSKRSEFETKLVEASQSVIDKQVVATKLLNKNDLALSKNTTRLSTFSTNLPEREEVINLNNQLSSLNKTIRSKLATKKAELKIDHHKSEIAEIKKCMTNYQNDLVDIARTLNEEYKLPLKLVEKIITDNLKGV